jgi:malate dehydrogenase (oxaloacetate-decarboxylating)
MLDYKIIKDKKDAKEKIVTSLNGKQLLTSPQLNKGTAFNKQERIELGLLGKLPSHIETLQQQVDRAYAQFLDCENDVAKSIYLRRIMDTNQVLFYRLVQSHTEEMLPILYTPLVGRSVRSYSKTFRQARGIYISYEDRDHIDLILQNRTNPEVKLIVVSDGEGVLGIGDQGIGGMDIPIAKLVVYTVFAGINPLHTLPVFLDVGTNNDALRKDPMYLGLRKKRIKGKRFDDFIDKFVTATKKHLPNAFLHWEDLGRTNAANILKRYKENTCTFNDDAQGTGSVALAALLAAVKVKGEKLEQQRIVIFGGGTAGMGTAQHVLEALMRCGLSEAQAKQRLWIIDRPGLLTKDLKATTKAQREFARHSDEVHAWTMITAGRPGLIDVVHNVAPTILIGCSGVGGAFTQSIIEATIANVKQPIIMPLSNPTDNSEAHPADILEWTQGRALIATGSPFGEVKYKNKIVPIAQCNNALAFPGIGLGVVACQAKLLTENMLWAATQALAKTAPILRDPQAPILPALKDAYQVSQKIAIAVVKQAILDGVTEIAADTNVTQLVKSCQWQPKYVPICTVG